MGLKQIDHKVQSHQNGTNESKSLKTAQVNKSTKAGHLYGDGILYSASSLGGVPRVPPNKVTLFIAFDKFYNFRLGFRNSSHWHPQSLQGLVSVTSPLHILDFFCCPNRILIGTRFVGRGCLHDQLLRICSPNPIIDGII